MGENRFQCPCCKNMIKVKDPHDFKNHYDDCLEQYENYLRCKDEENQAHIKLNAAVDEFNQTMRSLGIHDEAVAVIYHN